MTLSRRPSRLHALVGPDDEIETIMLYPFLIGARIKNPPLLPEIIIMVRRNKQYKQQPNIEFINKDYETVQLRDTYDLLLSLY